MRFLAFAAAAALFLAGAAEASHNRGSVLIPSISSNGTLTIEATSFWRTTGVGSVGGVSITGPNGFNQFLSLGSGAQDTSDSRFTRVDQSASTGIGSGGQGLYTISWNDCCRVSGISNAPESNMGTTSTIFWNGSSATKPIAFDIQNIQPNVVRGSNYSDNLDVVSPNGNTLSYDDSVLTVSITSQAPGFGISPTGQINIPAANTTNYPENAFNIGADVAFSGEIIAKNGGQTTGTVQFDWLFDAVAQGSNLVPDVADVVINAVVGDNINTNITATDPNGDPVTLTFISFNGPGGSIAGSSFTPGAPGSPVSGNFTWNSAGFTPGTYIATISGTDGGLTDQGTITINLKARTTVGVVPLPAGFILMGSALGGLGLMRRRRRT